MTLIPILKELSRRKKWVAIGPIFAVLIVLGLAKTVPSVTQYTATKQVLVDTRDSSVPNTASDMFNLISRAGVYAQIMTDTGVMNLIGKAAGIPGDEIAASGPPNTVGQSATHPATVASPGQYALALTLPNGTQQPIISIAAQATTGAKAVALANGAAVGLSEYVNQLAETYNVPDKHRISIRDLGAPSVSSAVSGVPKTLLAIVFLISLAGWCLLVVLGVRFVQGWKDSDGSISDPFSSRHDTALPASGYGSLSAESGQVDDPANVLAHNGSAEQRSAAIG